MNQQERLIKDTLTIEDIRNEMVRVHKEVSLDLKEPRKGWAHLESDFFKGYSQCLTEFIRFIDRNRELDLSNELDKEIKRKRI